MPASMPCTTAGEMASAARATRLSPNRICSAPARTVIAQVTAQPNSAIVSAMMTVSPAAGPLTCNAEPPSAPATTPPTTAAIRPATIGAPEASAMPSESGTATKNTTSDAGTSWRRFSSRRLPRPPEPGGACSRSRAAVIMMPSDFGCRVAK